MGWWLSHLSCDRQWDKGILQRKPHQREDGLGTVLALAPYEAGMEPEATVTDCSQTKDTGQQNPVCGTLGQTQEPWVLANTPWASSAGFSSIPHRPQLGGFMSPDALGGA